MSHFGEEDTGRRGEAPDAVAPRILGNSKPEEGEAKGEGWAVMRSLMLLIGGMVVLSYLIFAL